jgi:hypothetical protein
LWPHFYQSWHTANCPPHFWLLCQAYEREQLRGTIGVCFVALIDVVGVRITEQELVVRASRKIAFAVEPRQLALNVFSRGD